MKQTQYPRRPILLVDDEPHTLASFDIALRTAGINNTIRCSDSREVMTIVKERDVDILLLDLMMPHVSGQEILSAVNRDFPEIPVIIVTGVNEVETAVKCMKKGAFDYISKPVEADRLLPSVRRAIEIQHLRHENSKLSRNFLDDNLDRPESFSRITTQNRKIRTIFKYCAAISEGQQPVLITGETGVGKELFAQAIHNASDRRGKFVAVNVAGLDDHVFSDTLFGHTKGAFTGAERIRTGLVEKALGGSLFLDEIGDMSHASQVKLLRFLEEREYYPLGSDMARSSDARIIVATHKDIKALQQSEQFRSDLYFRFCTHHVHIPPLRERREDTPLLFEHFLAEAAEEFDKKKPAYPRELLTLLQSYHFPGNVRELKAMVFDAVSSHGGRMLSTSSFKAAMGNSVQSTSDVPRLQTENGASWAAQLERLPSLKEANHVLIAEALRRADNNQRAAALMLGISPQALNQRLKRG